MNREVNDLLEKIYVVEGENVGNSNVENRTSIRSLESEGKSLKIV